MVWTDSLTLAIFALVGSRTSAYTIQVCQNKDCCRNFKGRSRNLVQTLESILPDGVAVEATGCLSMCAAGPNICVKQDDKILHLHEIDTANTAAASLELMDDSLSIHPKLLAAWSCAEKSYKETTFAGKEKYLNSIVNSLQKSPELVKSKAMAHALVLRAQARLDENHPNLAREDALWASSIDPAHSMVWRVLADTEEANHNIPQAIEALIKWADENPLFKSKAQNEIERLKMAY